jgi:hypothetical protein
MIFFLPVRTGAYQYLRTAVGWANSLGIYVVSDFLICSWEDGRMDCSTNGLTDFDAVVGSGEFFDRSIKKKGRFRKRLTACVCWTLNSMDYQVVKMGKEFGEIHWYFDDC